MPVIRLIRSGKHGGKEETMSGTIWTLTSTAPKPEAYKLLLFGDEKEEYKCGVCGEMMSRGTPVVLAEKSEHGDMCRQTAAVHAYHFVP